MPSLRPPEGAVVRPSGGGSSSGHIESEVDIESTLPADTLFLHYARQLTAAGWAPDTQAVSAGVSIGRWTTQDDEGRPLVGVLTIWGKVAPGSYSARVRMEKGQPEG